MEEANLLPVGYFHVVFTLPAQVADIAFHHKALVYDLLFSAASQTMLTIAADRAHVGKRAAAQLRARLHPAVPGHAAADAIVPDVFRFADTRPGRQPWLAAALALTLHASAFLGEIWRGCIEAVPAGQSEASWALGLSYFDRMKSVVLPQAVRITIAPTAGFLVQLIKGTSLASIIGFVDLMRAAQIINNATYSPLQAYGLVTLIYLPQSQTVSY